MAPKASKKHDLHPHSGLCKPRISMISQIDLLKFQESSGELKWLPVVAAAFLRQLPQWRVDFDAALAADNRTQQFDLLHKIRGSCYAVAAYSAIEVIEQSEALHARGKAVASAKLMRQLALVEAELQNIVAQAPA